MPLKRPGGILVDYGGTLVEETSFDARAGNELLLTRAAFVPSHITIEHVLARANLISGQVAERRDQFQVETPWPALTRLIHDYLGIRFADCLSELELAFWAASVTTTAMPGAREALDEFHRHGVPVAVVSNCSFARETLRYELSRHSLAEHLAFVMVSAEYSVRKPNALIFDTAAAKLGIEASDIWFVGDRFDIDVAGATAAGMKPIWFGANSEAGPEVLSAPNWNEVVRLFRESC